MSVTERLPEIFSAILTLTSNFLSRPLTAFTVGVGGPVGSGKTALMLALCKKLRDTHNIAAVTNVSAASRSG